MKSPAMQEALKPLHRLEADARAENDVSRKDYETALVLHKIEKEVGAGKAKDALKKGISAEGLLDIDEPQDPKAKRYVTNDTTYETLGEILADNPNGVLAYRDELVSLLRTLDREEYAGARGFLPDGLERNERIHVRPHHARQDAYRGGMRLNSRLYTTRTPRRIYWPRLSRRGRR